MCTYTIYCPGTKNHEVLNNLITTAMVIRREMKKKRQSYMVGRVSL